MCWVGNVENRKIATEDIKTKKIVDLFEGRYYGYYQELFEYELGKTYKTEINPTRVTYDDNVRVIDVGYHSYAWDIEIKSLCGGDIRVKGLGLLGGKTTYTNRHGFGNGKVVVVECTIPKGTVYWENCVGEIVSEKLILEEEIYIEDDCNFC